MPETAQYIMNIRWFPCGVKWHALISWTHEQGRWAVSTTYTFIICMFSRQGLVPIFKYMTPCSFERKVLANCLYSTAHSFFVVGQASTAFDGKAPMRSTLESCCFRPACCIKIEEVHNSCAIYTFFEMRANFMCFSEEKIYNCRLVWTAIVSYSYSCYRLFPNMQQTNKKWMGGVRFFTFWLKNEC